MRPTDLPLFLSSALLASACLGDLASAGRDAGQHAAEAGSVIHTPSSGLRDAASPESDAASLPGSDAAFPHDAGHSLDANSSMQDASSVLEAGARTDAGGPHDDAGDTADAGINRCPLEGGHRIYAGGDYTCAVLKKYGSKGSAACWGSNNGYKLSHGLRPSGPDSLGELNRRERMPIRAVTGPLEVLDIVTGSDFTCFALNGDFKCASTRYGWVPVSLTQEPNLQFPWGVFDAYGGGTGHYCVRVPSSTTERYTVCKGNNSRKQSGGSTATTGDYGGSYVHGEYAEVAIGGEHTCALTTWTTNNIECWGDNRGGQVTGAASAEPVGYAFGLTLFGTPEPDAAGVAAGYRHSCALTKQGKVQCWGDNSYGQLGRGDLAAHVGPAEVAQLSDVTAIDAGLFHTCARLADGTVKCWGRNTKGQLGTGSTSPQEPMPVAMSLPESATQLSVGDEHSCVIGESTRMWCTGDGGSGRLGNGADDDVSMPTQVIVPCDKGTAP